MKHITLWIAILTPIATWILNNIVTALVSELPAPTKDSTEKYKYWFRVLNKVVGNLRRSRSTTIEDSPNWQDASQAHVEKVLNGQAPVSVLLSPAIPSTAGQPSPYSST